MKLTCNREKLLAAFQLAASVAPTRSPKEILHNVKVEATADAVTLMATDMEIGIRIEVDGVEVLTPGKALFPVQRVSSILRETNDDELEFSIDENSLKVKGQYSKFELPTGNPDEFPTVAGFEEEAYHSIPARAFREMVKRTVFATDPDSTRYALGGVLLEMGESDVIAVGTDGRRLARMIGKGESVGGHESNGTTIVPTRSLTLMERSLTDKDESVQLSARANDILLRTSRCTIYSRLVEGRYPNWRQVLPQRDESIKIDLSVGPFYAALRQAAIVTDQESRGIDFQFGNGSLVMIAKTANIGRSRVEFPIAYTGEVVMVMMDHRFVADFLKVLESDATFYCEISTSAEPALFTTEDGYAYVVMPMARDN